MNNNIFPRLGTFFILVGCGFLVLFIGSILAREFSIFYLLFGVAAFLLGFILHRAGPHPEPTRFSAIRKVSQRSRLSREEKQTEESTKK